MNTITQTSSSEGAIWARIVHPDTGNLSREAARALLDLDFDFADRKQMEQLAEKASSGTLTVEERSEAESYNRVAHLLALLQSKARQALHARK